MAKFEIEEFDGRGYKHVHAAGCRNLRDPEPVESEPTMVHLLDAVQGFAVADTEDELRPMLAPCARKLIK